ncbi:protein kinase [Streptomyces sp. NPDC006259]|uniref:serine/threonine-protein kinase n=1 Tax=Streptomyces sp. NPDC006259 TaxID=3364740 RepID=UPI0036CA90F7
MGTGGSDRRVVDGRFELVERLGAGGMGWVWRAHDLALHRDVAVKEVRPPDPDLAEYDPEGARRLRERVLREARALARVHHPNVVTIHHIVDGGDATYPWIVMELVEGGSLQDCLEDGTLTPAEAARLGRELLSALRAAHTAGIEHRDVKPANVLLRPDGRPVLTDFGIAAVRESVGLTATGAVIGSPDFMAPERVSGKDGGPAADLWSLAMLLYVAVEGHHPLRRGSTLATLAAVLGEDVPAPRRAGPLAPVLTALLVRDPRSRPDAERVDRMLAAVTDGPAPRTEAGAPGASRTSYPLTPPAPAIPATGSAHAMAAPQVTAAPGPHRPRRARGAAIAAAAAGTALTGVLVWTLLPDGGKPTDGTAAPTATGSRGTASRTTGPTTASPSTSPVDTTADRTDLLGAKGLRTAVAKLTDAMGGSKVTSLVVYEEYAVATAPVPDRPKLYDRYMYRGGDVAVKFGPGGTVTDGSVPVDLDDVVWDAVPALLTRATRTLGVPDPTSRYLIVNPASTVFDTDPTLSVYLSDEYGSAYLKADLRGRIIETYPRDDG